MKYDNSFQVILDRIEVRHQLFRAWIQPDLVRLITKLWRYCKDGIHHSKKHKPIVSVKYIVPLSTEIRRFIPSLSLAHPAVENSNERLFCKSAGAGWKSHLVTTFSSSSALKASSCGDRGRKMIRFPVQDSIRTATLTERRPHRKQCFCSSDHLVWSG